MRDLRFSSGDLEMQPAGGSWLYTVNQAANGSSLFGQAYLTNFLAMVAVD